MPAASKGQPSVSGRQLDSRHVPGNQRRGNGGFAETRLFPDDGQLLADTGRSHANHTREPFGPAAVPEYWAPAEQSVVDTDFEYVAMVIFGNAPRIAPPVAFVAHLRADNAPACALERRAHKLPDAEHVRRVIARSVDLIPIRREVERLLLTASQRPGTGAGSVARKVHGNLA